MICLCRFDLNDSDYFKIGRLDTHNSTCAEASNWPRCSRWHNSYLFYNLHTWIFLLNIFQVNKKEEKKICRPRQKYGEWKRRVSFQVWMQTARDETPTIATRFKIDTNKPSVGDSFFTRSSSFNSLSLLINPTLPHCNFTFHSWLIQRQAILSR